MDPYGDNHRKFLSPLDKKKETEEVKVDEEEKSEEKLKKDSQSKKETIEKTKDVKEETKAEPQLTDHLNDLRKQLIKGVAVFLLFFIGVFASINLWFPYVTRGHDLVVLGPMEVVKFYMSISAALAVGLALPFLCHFLWQFVKPGLNEKERKFLSLYSPVMFILFLIGIAFGYFIVNPLSYNFLISLGAINFQIMVSAQEYASFLLLTTLPLGLLFELPIVAMFLATIGLLTGETMKKVRKWSYVSLAVLSALITPPDFISQLIVLIPMIILYEISIRIVQYVEKKSHEEKIEEVQN